MYFSAVVACLCALLNHGPAAASESIDNSYDLLAAMGQAYERAYAGINNLTEFQEPKSIGMGQEISRRCEKNPEDR